MCSIGSPPPALRAYDVAADSTQLANSRVFIRMENGNADGLRLDVDGNLWCGWADGEGRDGVMIFVAAAAPASMLRLVISMGYPSGN